VLAMLWCFLIGREIHRGPDLAAPRQILPAPAAAD
jgi:hypothetical protein